MISSRAEEEKQPRQCTCYRTCAGPFSQDGTERRSLRVPGPCAAHVALSGPKQKQTEVPLKYICCFIYGSFGALPPLSLVLAEAPLWSMIQMVPISQTAMAQKQPVGAACGCGALLAATAEALRLKPFPHYLLFAQTQKVGHGCLPDA